MYKFIKGAAAGDCDTDYLFEDSELSPLLGLLVYFVLFPIVWPRLIFQGRFIEQTSKLFRANVYNLAVFFSLFEPVTGNRFISGLLEESKDNSAGQNQECFQAESDLDVAMLEYTTGLGLILGEDLPGLGIEIAFFALASGSFEAGERSILFLSFATTVLHVIRQLYELDFDRKSVNALEEVASKEKVVDLDKTFFNPGANHEKVFRKWANSEHPASCQNLTFRGTEASFASGAWLVKLFEDQELWEKLRQKASLKYVKVVCVDGGDGFLALLKAAPGLFSELDKRNADYEKHGYREQIFTFETLGSKLE